MDGETKLRRRPIAVFPDFIMQFLINLCGRDKYSGVTAILIDITKEYS